MPLTKEERSKMLRLQWATGVRKVSPHFTHIGILHSEETKRKISEAKSGIQLSLETRRRMSVAKTGRKLSNETKQKLRELHLGKLELPEAVRKNRELRLREYAIGKRVSPFVAIWADPVKSATMVEKMSNAKKGSPAWNYGKANPKLRGPNNWRWKGGVSSERKNLWGSLEWQNWRRMIYIRDNFTCQECGVRGVYFEAHHITPIRSDRSRIFDITNGITLCRPCHNKTKGKEELFVERYSAKIVVQVSA